MDTKNLTCEQKEKIKLAVRWLRDGEAALRRMTGTNARTQKARRIQEARINHADSVLRDLEQHDLSRLLGREQMAINQIGRNNPLHKVAHKDELKKVRAQIKAALKEIGV